MLGHPKGLYILFSTEAAERFSFYTMRALLVLYLTSVIFIGQYTGSTIKGDEVEAAVRLNPAAVLDQALDQLNKVQHDRLNVALGTLGTDASTIWTAAVAKDLPGQVDLAISDLKTDLNGLFDTAVSQLGADPTPFVQWVIKQKIHLLIRTEALSLYGLYLLLVYTAGLVGGYFADKVLGSRKSILMGGIVMCAGLFVMGVPGPTTLFYGLGLIIAGNGFFKPNISTIVSGLYEDRDPRRDGAFTIFYMGINLGAFLAVFGAGVAEKIAKTHEWGWNIGFVIAAVGMIFSLSLFLWGQRHLGLAGFPPGRAVTAESRLLPADYKDIAVWAVAVIAIVLAVIFAWNWIGPVWRSLPVWAQILIGAFIAVAALWGAFGHDQGPVEGQSQRLSTEEWQRVAVIAILSLFVIFFWMGFEQAGGTMNLFAFEQTDRHIFGWEMPATWFQGFNPMFIFILAPLFSLLWNWNDRQRWGLKTPAKMGVGLILLGVGFGVMYLGQLVADDQGKAALWWLVGVYLVHTVAELCLSPIGLSMVTKLSPVRIVSLMMGVWFFCTAMADWLSGQMEAITHYFGLGLWSTLIGTSLVPGIVLIALSPLLTRWMHGRA